MSDLVALSAQVLNFACNMLVVSVLVFASLCFACMAVEKAIKIFRKVRP